MTGFQLRTSGIASGSCTNWATTTALHERTLMRKIDLEITRRRRRVFARNGWKCFHVYLSSSSCATQKMYLKAVNGCAKERRWLYFKAFNFWDWNFLWHKVLNSAASFIFEYDQAGGLLYTIFIKRDTLLTSQQVPFTCLASADSSSYLTGT